jgi:hypothetical protein
MGLSRFSALAWEQEGTIWEIVGVQKGTCISLGQGHGFSALARVLSRAPTPPDHLASWSWDGGRGVEAPWPQLHPLRSLA